jgi:hypothetical protein
MLLKPTLLTGFKGFVAGLGVPFQIMLRGITSVVAGKYRHWRSNEHYAAALFK